MSDITTFSQFYYGQTISNGSGTGGLGNNLLNFDEGAGELTAELNQGDYTLTQFGAEIARAMNSVGLNTYTVTVDRDTRIITIISDVIFTLLCNSGSSTSVSPWDIMGFSTAADRAGDTSYDGDFGCGSVYRPQAIVFDYIGILDFQVKQDAVVNVSASGQVQTVQFGDVGFIEMNIKPISNITEGINKTTFEKSTTGVQDARTFMNYLITKAKVEFMKDRDNPDAFTPVILEKSGQSSSGTSFQLESIIKGYYETGGLVFREVIV